jgi:uncharacterized protein YodC (DUF2158 family)
MADHPLIGKIVQPKSGGLPMTVGAVKDIDGVEYAICSWFDGKKNVTDKFPVAALKESKPIPPLSRRLSARF